MANRILTSIELWKADRTAEIDLPSWETFRAIMSSEFQVQKSLGKTWSASMSIRASSQLATASPSDAYYLTKKKIIRLIYDDDSIEEWRIKGIGREFSGESDYRIDMEPIWMDLAYTGLRRTLSTGDVRTNVNFYAQSVDDLLTNLLSADYNCPALFTKGTIDSTIGAKVPRLSLNGVTLMDALKAIADATDAEWGVSYDSVNDDYEIDFYQAGNLGGGSGQASDRPVQMGNGRGNRKNMLMRSLEEDFYSRIIPIAGTGNDTTGIGNLTVQVTQLASNIVDIESGRDIIIEDDFPITSSAGETLYFGNETVGWREVISTDATNQQMTLASSSGVGASYTGRFALGTSKKKLTYFESPQAVSDIGIVERTYRRTDIPIRENLIKAAGKSDDFSEWSGGMPVGWIKVGTPTVEEETGDEFVKFGTKSAKVSADSDEGIRTSVDIDFDPSNPYASLISYIYVESGSIRLELEDADGNLVPEGQFAESNSAALQGLALQAAQPANGIALIRIIALEDSTVFYVDAAVLTNSASLIQFAPKMGIYDLWDVAGRELLKTGGLQGNQYSGTVWDDSYFPNDGTFREIDIGTWVQFRDGWNGTTFGFTENLRVIECSYAEAFKHGRVQKTVTLSNRPTDLEQFLGQNYVTQSSTQEGTETQLVRGVNALQNALKKGLININDDGSLNIVGILSFGTAQTRISYNSTTDEWEFFCDGPDIVFGPNGSKVKFQNADVEISRVGFYGTGAVGSKPTVTGSRGSNTALASLLTALADFGLITDSTT